MGLVFYKISLMMILYTTIINEKPIFYLCDMGK